MILDIIVPHYNEPWEECEKLFEMLALQRGVDFSSFRVLLVNDGNENSISEQVCGRRYPYDVVDMMIPHKGVSAARNRGLDYSDADWVMFCDCDDTFTDIYALKCIMDGLKNPDCDLAWTAFYSETSSTGIVIKRDWFCHLMLHGKVFRRQTLVDIGLRFNEQLDYAEDTAFVTMFLMDVPMTKIGEVKCGFVPYVWTFRYGSATSDPKRAKRNAIGLFRKNGFIADEYRKRGRKSQGYGMAYRTMCDAYVILNRKDIETDQSFVEEVREFCGRWMDCADYVDDDVQAKAISGALRESILAKEEALPKADGFKDWYNSFKEN